METPVYVFTGLLESGKTTLLQEVAQEENFLDPGNSVVVQCEEGEVSLSEEFLKKHSMTLVKVKSADELTEEFWKSLEKKYKPAQILIEYNGMWELEKLFNDNIPEDWFAGGVYSAVNAETAEMYMTNMRKMFMEPLKASNLVIFNRCDDNTDRMKFRRAIKMLNPAAQVAFERNDETMMTDDDDVMPFDYSGQEISIEDMDFGLWYLDAIDHPDRYIGKEIEFTAKYCASGEPNANYFIPGRHIMTCCADDIQFLGYICYFDDDTGTRFNHGDWVHVKVLFNVGVHEMYGFDMGPILKLLSIEPAERPQQELVTFT
jgi:putative membrane protein